MIQALRLVLAGGIYLPPLSIGPYPARRRTNPGSPPAEDANYAGSRLGNLSPRQLDALMLAVQGKSNKLIAWELSIAEGTVKLHLSAAYRALGVSNRTEAVYVAAEMGLRALPDK